MKTIKKVEFNEDYISKVQDELRRILSKEEILPKKFQMSDPPLWVVIDREPETIIVPIEVPSDLRDKIKRDRIYVVSESEAKKF